VNKILPITLWIMAICFLIIVVYFRQIAFEPLPSTTGNSGDPPGAVLIDVPWKHLPDVDRFQLKDQTGNPFDSADLVGKPYLVSFFFATCPSICRDLNSQVKRLNDQLEKEDVTFISITVDPENDTPEVLGRYAQDYDADPQRWVFLTDQMYKIKQLGEQVFRVVVDKDTHTDNILLVDRWGRYRDRFKWDDPYDMKRLLQVVKDVAAEQDPPLEKSVHTRNVLAGREPINFNQVPWIREFHLTERSGETFFSRDLTGHVWIANFFFTSCPEICKKQTAYLRNMRERLGDRAPLIVSISTDPTNDSLEVLRKFADQQEADDRWLFCTGPQTLINRIGSEFFHAQAAADHHSSLLYIVDRWGQVRGNFDWQDPAAEPKMLQLIEQLESETRPQRPVDSPASPEINKGDDQ
jgi:cytochrome oxidase Cu insertion factor (SCO1/SenC/PrrC family)